MGCGSTKSAHVDDPKNPKSVAPEKAKATGAAPGGNRGLLLLKELSDDKSRGIVALMTAAGEPTAAAAAPPPPAPAPEQKKEEAKPAEPAAAPRDIGAFDLKTRARVAQRGPFAVDVEAGKTYYWCQCGHSKTQPFCDGSHVAINEKEGTSFAPLAWTAPETKKVYLCGCKQTNTAPFCDGSHAGLPEEKKEEAPKEEKPAEQPPAAAEKPAEADKPADAAAAAPNGSGMRSVDILKELADEQQAGGKEYRGINLLHEVLSSPTAQ